MHIFASFQRYIYTCEESSLGVLHDVRGVYEVESLDARGRWIVVQTWELFASMCFLYIASTGVWHVRKESQKDIQRKRARGREGERERERCSWSLTSRSLPGPRGCPRRLSCVLAQSREPEKYLSFPLRLTWAKDRVCTSRLAASYMLFHSDQIVQPSLGVMARMHLHLYRKDTCNEKVNPLTAYRWGSPHFALE